MHVLNRFDRSRDCFADRLPRTLGIELLANAATEALDRFDLIQDGLAFISKLLLARWVVEAGRFLKLLVDLLQAIAVAFESLMSTTSPIDPVDVSSAKPASNDSRCVQRNATLGFASSCSMYQLPFVSDVISISLLNASIGVYLCVGRRNPTTDFQALHPVSMR